MNTLRSLACALLLTCAFLLSSACAQLEPGVTSSVQRVATVDTGWVDSPITLAYPMATDLGPVAPITLGTIVLNRPARLVASFEIRYSCLTENTYAVPVEEYQVYSRNDVRLGNAGFQLCSQLCGAVVGQDALAPSDGAYFAIPSPLPDHNVGVGDPNSDHHLMPVSISFPIAYELAPGPTPITIQTSGGMATWNHEPVQHDSHAWRLGWPRYQARVRGVLVR